VALGQWGLGRRRDWVLLDLGIRWPFDVAAWRNHLGVWAHARKEEVANKVQDLTKPQFQSIYPIK
jgi:hypothetical protein